jgi:acyl carrier protein
MHQVSLEELAELLGEIIDLSGIKIDDDAVLGDDIPVDSREMLRFLSHIESRYRFRFSPREVLGFKTLGDVLQTVQQKASQAS